MSKIVKIILPEQCEAVVQTEMNFTTCHIFNVLFPNTEQPKDFEQTEMSALLNTITVPDLLKPLCLISVSSLLNCSPLSLFFFSFSNMFSAGFWPKESRFLISLREGVEEGIRQGRKGKSNFLCFNSHPHIHIRCFCQYSMNSIWSDGQ